MPPIFFNIEVPVAVANFSVAVSIKIPGEPHMVAAIRKPPTAVCPQWTETTMKVAPITAFVLSEHSVKRRTGRAELTLHEIICLYREKI